MTPWHQSPGSPGIPCGKEVIDHMQYVKPAILATYVEAELTAEAAVCTGYGHEYDFKKWKWGWW